MIRISETDLLDSAWGRDLSDADVGLAWRLLALTLRRGYNGIELPFVQATLPGQSRAAINLSGLVKAGILCSSGQRITWSRAWLHRRLPDRVARKLLANDMTGQPLTAAEDVVSKPITRKKAPTASDSTQNCVNRVRLSNPKGARDLTGEEVSRFTCFWDAFALKTGKTGAINAWLRIELQAKRASAFDFEIIFRAAGIEAYLRSMRRNASPKYAEGWLSEQRWLDEVYEHDPRNWTSDEEVILNALAGSALYEQWTDVTPGRRDTIRRAITQMGGDAARVAQYITVAAVHCRWNHLQDANGRVPVAMALSPQVMTQQREYLQNLRQQMASRHPPATAPSSPLQPASKGVH